MNEEHVGGRASASRGGAGRGLDDLDATVDVHADEVEVELREILVHMVDEYARHAGHADLLRECIDGRTGQ